MYAANAKATAVLARPYTTEAPEVEALLRLEEAGLRVDEVPVNMRPRASGESKLRGKKAFLVVVTIAGTILAYTRLAPAELTVRLVAVLGYSNRRTRGLHALCAERLQHAEGLVADGDAVLLSGWSRRRGHSSEAELMRRAWNGGETQLIEDATARSTTENAVSVAEAARRLGATDVTVVTSALACLSRAGRSSAPPCPVRRCGPRRRRAGLPLSVLARELGCLAALPYHLIRIRANGR